MGEMNLIMGEKVPKLSIDYTFEMAFLAPGPLWHNLDLTSA